MAFAKQSRLQVVSEEEYLPEPDLTAAPTPQPAADSLEKLLLLEQRLMEKLTTLEKKNSLILEIVLGTTKTLIEKLTGLLLPLLATLGAFFLWQKDTADQANLISLGLYGALIEIPVLLFFWKKR